MNLLLYFSHPIAKQGTIFKDTCPVPLAVLFTMDLQTGHPDDRYHARVVLLLLYTMNFFLYFSESIRYFISGVL